MILRLPRWMRVLLTVGLIAGIAASVPAVREPMMRALGLYSSWRIRSKWSMSSSFPSTPMARASSTPQISSSAEWQSEWRSSRNR